MPTESSQNPSRDTPAPRVHLMIPTHTTRHLAACLGSLRHQTRPPACVALSCDNDREDIAELAQSTFRGPWADRWPDPHERPRLLLCQRPHQGIALLNQVRNNGLRTLLGPGGAHDDDLVVVLDGDTMLGTEAIQQHFALLRRGAEVVIPYRVNLSQAVTNELDLDMVLSPDGARLLEALCTTEDREALARRDTRYRRQLWCKRYTPRWMGLVKRHKPKVIGGHHGVTVGMFRAVNGYDERYEAYGANDDDLALRLHALPSPPRVSIAVRTILAFHLWHPTRAVRPPTESPGYAIFRDAGGSPLAPVGLVNPREQATPLVREATDGGWRELPWVDPPAVARSSA